MEDWFDFRKDPFEGVPEDESELFEYTLKLPHPPDQVVQTVRIEGGQLIITYRFVFADPDMLETEDFDF